MARNRVLIIDGDDWVARLLAEGLRDHGSDVSTCLSGASALSVARTIQPDCVLLEMILPELDGVSLARSMRAEPSRLARVPIIFISNADDIASKSAAFAAGGDVFLSKPFRVDEVALQVQALVGMASRLGGQPGAASETEGEAEPESMAPGGHAIEGNIEQMSVATVLTLLEMERRSGTLKVAAGNRKCTLDIVAGYAIGGSIGTSTVAPLAALREILRWQAGRFRFTPGTDGTVPANNRRSIGALLIEAVRLDDESAMAREGWVGDEGPTARKSWPLLAPSSAPPPSKRAGHVSPARRASRPPPPLAQQRVSRPPPPAAAPASAPVTPARPAPGPSRPAAPARRAPPLPPQVPRKKS